MYANVHIVVPLVDMCCIYMSHFRLKAGARDWSAAGARYLAAPATLAPGAGMALYRAQKKGRIERPES